MQEIKTFAERINKEILPFIDLSKNSKESKSLNDRILANLLGERIPDDHLPIGEMTPRRAYLANIFKKYFEVKESFQRLKLTQIFLTNVQTKKVPRIDYIRYHYEYYLNGIYITNCRINVFLDFLIKKSKREKLVDEVLEINRIKKALNKTTAGIIKIRGLHVHEKHYKSDKLDQLLGLDSLSNDFDFIRSYRDLELKDLKKNIAVEVKENIENLETFFENDMYRHLEGAIFKKLLPK
jgi:hypothetical protein